MPKPEPPDVSLPCSRVHYGATIMSVQADSPTVKLPFMARTEILFVMELVPPLVGVKVKAGAVVSLLVATGLPFTSNWKEDTLTNGVLVNRRAEKLTVVLLVAGSACGAPTNTAGFVVR